MKVKYKFSVSTRYVGSKYEEEFEEEFDDSHDKDSIRDALNAEYQEWVWDKIDGGVHIESIE